ncbi:hypothetical protein H8M03_06175 [Sphingomonas sabuli]|uniref:Peptidase M10 serralysin C-terminal domain-containing protein n=1 Tax=Sphingomonas sabuli TaxID=2764186 RepID=A0A7G9L5W7_9SPHN|nr:hypothetical protein H8M03_06175 [Sphingomonas sabuli]
MTGGDGGDTLSGGAGNDTMTGGDGYDTFVFTDADIAGGVYSDVITDAYVTRDTMDLSGIDADVNTNGDQAFHIPLDLSSPLLVADHFSGAAGELILIVNDDGTWTLMGDVNGDAAADFAITVSHRWTADQIIL